MYSYGVPAAVPAVAGGYAAAGRYVANSAGVVHVAKREAEADAEPYYYSGYHGLGYGGYGLGYRTYGYGVTSTARGRLMLRPSLTTTAATMDSATEDTDWATAPTDTAVTSTAELPDPPASGRDQPRLVTGLSAESGFGS